MNIPQWISENWDLFARNPAPFVALLMLGVAAGYLISAHRIASLKERIELYKDKLDGDSPEEARQRIRKLEDRIGEMVDIEIDTEAAESIRRILKATSGQLMINSHLVVSFGQHAAEQLHRIFESAGWRVSRGKSMWSAGTVKEIVLSAPEEGEGRKEADTVSRVLAAAGLKFRTEFREEGAFPHPSISFHA